MVAVRTVLWLWLLALLLLVAAELLALLLAPPLAPLPTTAQEDAPPMRAALAPSEFAPGTIRRFL